MFRNQENSQLQRRNTPDAQPQVQAEAGHRQEYHSAALQEEVKGFLHESREFHQAQAEDELRFGADIRAEIRRLIEATIAVPTPKNLLKKWIGEIHQLGQRKNQNNNQCVSLRSDKDPNPKNSVDHGKNGTSNSTNILKFKSRKVLLDFLIKLAADKRFNGTNGTNGTNGEGPNHTSQRTRTGPIDTNLSAALQKVKSDAKRLVRQGQTEKAIKLLVSAYEKDHNAQRNIGFVGYITNLYWATEQYEQAFIFAEKILALDSTDILGIWTAALAAEKLQKWEKALNYAEDFLSNFPDHTAALGIAALAAEKLQKWGKALEYASKKIRQKNEDRNPLAPIGIAANAAYQLGKYDEALRYSVRYVQFSARNGEKLKIAAMSAYYLQKPQIALHYARKYFHAGTDEAILTYGNKNFQHKFPYNHDITKVIAECAWKLGLIDR